MSQSTHGIRYGFRVLLVGLAVSVAVIAGSLALWR
jgi:hypothetical protein